MLLTVVQALREVYIIVFLDPWVRFHDCSGIRGVNADAFCPKRRQVGHTACMIHGTLLIEMILGEILILHDAMMAVVPCKRCAEQKKVPRLKL